MNTHCHDCADISGKAQQTGSTKIRKIMEILETIDKESNGEDKTIIFSQFTTMLDLIEPVLIQRGIRWVRCRFHVLHAVFHTDLHCSRWKDEGA